MKTELYSVIKSPYLTEKVSSLMGESNQYAFKVDINATKLQVKKAVEGYFSVNVAVSYTHLTLPTICSV